MRPRILITYLEESKFSAEAYQAQSHYLAELAASFEQIIDLTNDSIATIFTDIDCRTAISITTDASIAEQMQGLGIPVVGFEADPLDMMKANFIVLGLDEFGYEDVVRVYQRFHKIPWDILETKRTHLREFGMDDLKALRELYEKPHVTDYIEPLYGEEQERIYQESYIEKIYGFYGFGMWLVFHKETGAMIGRAGLEYRETCQDGEVEMGYVFAPEFWHQGYATEVCNALMDYAFDELSMQCILCRVSPDNIASIRLLEKLGFFLSEEGEEWIYRYKR